jgi:hypothetical protein
MDYQKHYDRLIARARGRALNSYTERHHVLPRCLGGSDALCNIVRLTAEEHYVAHQILCKLHPRNPGLVYAAIAMAYDAHGRRQNNKLYGWLRRRAVGMKLSEATRAKMRASRAGYRHSEATLAKMRGRVKSAGEIEKLREAHRGRIYMYTQEQRKKIGDINRGKALSNTQRAAFIGAGANAWIGRKHSGETKMKMQAAWVIRRNARRLVATAFLDVKYYCGIQLGKRRIPPASEIIASRYMAGESAATIARYYGITRETVCKGLQYARCPIRSLSEAMVIRMGRMTAEERWKIGEAGRVALHSKPFSAEYRKKLSAASVIREQNKRMKKELQL